MAKYDFRSEKEKEFPSMVHIENTNVCNLRCIHCPQNDLSKVSGYRPQYMNYNLIKKVIDEVAENGSVFRITSDGEPLLHKNFREMIDYVYGKKVKIFAFNTNGNLMDEEIVKTLVRPSKFTKVAVEVSLDALYKKTYEKIRLGSDYNRVMRNIFNFLKTRNEKKADNVKLLVSIINQPEVAGEIEQFDKYWSQVADKVITRKYVDTKGMMPSKNQKYDSMVKRWPCVIVYKRIMIGYDGKIRFCPDDWKKESVIGDIRKNSIKEIWQSGEYRKLRVQHQKNDLTERIPCNYCKEWQAIKWDYNYKQALDKLFNEKKNQSR